MDVDVLKEYNGKDNQEDIKSSSEGSKINVDEFLERVGGYGRFQVIMQILAFFFVISFAYQTLIMYFIANNPGWKCVTSNSSKFCKENYGKNVDISDSNFTYRCQMKRSEWEYTTKKDFSIVTEFDLICEKESLAVLANSIFFIGWAIGGVFIGFASDILGRKTVMTVCQALVAVSAICSSYITAVWQLTILRSIIGAAYGGFHVCCYILLSEFIVPNYRSMSGSIYQIPFSLSIILLTVVASVEKSWRKLELYIALPGCLSFLFSFCLSQSPRWLYASGKTTEAEKVLNNVAKFNKKPLVGCYLATLKNQATIKKYSYIDLFRNCQILKMVCVQGIGWFAVGLIFYGLSLESSDLGGNMYFNMILSSLADFPGCFVCAYFCSRFGRKKSVLVSIFICAVLMVGIAAIPKSWSRGFVTRISLALIGKFFINVAFSGFYIWSFELFPTVLRAQGMIVNIITCHIGASIAPFIVSVLQGIYPPLPFIVMSGIAFVATVFGLVLPETNKKPTRETYEDFFDKQENVVTVNGCEEDPDDNDRTALLEEN